MYALCPDCGEVMEIERVHNGVAMVWHGVHCGWGQDAFTEDAVYQTEHEAGDASLERLAAELWRNDHPEMSVFACDVEMKQKYRARILNGERPVRIHAETF